MTQTVHRGFYFHLLFLFRGSIYCMDPSITIEMFKLYQILITETEAIHYFLFYFDCSSSLSIPMKKSPRGLVSPWELDFHNKATAINPIQRREIAIQSEFMTAATSHGGNS